MTNTDWDEEAIVKGMHRITNTEQVIKYVKEPLQEVITPLLKGKKFTFRIV